MACGNDIKKVHWLDHADHKYEVVTGYMYR